MNREIVAHAGTQPDPVTKGGRTATGSIQPVDAHDVAGDLRLVPALERADLLAPPVHEALAAGGDAVASTGMEYGGITPVGLPAGWPVLVDARVHAAPWVVIGSGVRRSKLVVPGSFMAEACHGEVSDELAVPAAGS